MGKHSIKTKEEYLNTNFQKFGNGTFNQAKYGHHGDLDSAYSDRFKMGPMAKLFVITLFLLLFIFIMLLFLILDPDNSKVVASVISTILS